MMTFFSESIYDVIYDLNGMNRVVGKEMGIALCGGRGRRALPAVQK